MPAIRDARRRFIGLCAGALLLVLGLPGIATADFPERNITVIVPYSPGGQGDVFARRIGERLTQALGKSVIVDNRPGATGALGTRLAVKAPADGYTLLLGQTGEIAINGAAMKDPGYDTLKDLRAIALVGDSPLVMVVPANSPYKTLPELIKAARDNPGSVAYASSGTATPGHLAGAALAAGSKTEMTHVPYKGAGPAITDVIGGQVAFFFASASSVMPHVKGGKVRALAVSSAKRLPTMADVPTVAETLPGFEFSLWGGYFAPRGTPDAVVQRLNAEINKVIAEPEMRARFEAEGSAVAATTPQRFEQFVRDEIAKYTRLVKATGAQLE